MEPQLPDLPIQVAGEGLAKIVSVPGGQAHEEIGPLSR
jgi:hypothetical protein